MAHCRSMVVADRSLRLDDPLGWICQGNTVMGGCKYELHMVK